MFERLTEQASRVMVLANDEAHRLGHEYLGTEHILLGLVKEDSGAPANVFRALHVDLDTMRLEVEKLVKTGPDAAAKGKLPETPRARNVRKYAIKAMRELKSTCIGSEHLLLGLLQDNNSVATQVLLNLNLCPEEVREAVLNLLSQSTGAK